MRTPDGDNEDSKWESFETYKGEPLKELPGWLDELLRIGFSLLGLSLVFVISGGLLWLVVYRYGGAYGLASRSFALAEQDWMSWARFIAGGTLGVFFFVRHWLRRK